MDWVDLHLATPRARRCPRKRPASVETIFAEMKAVLGLNRATLQGRERVQILPRSSEENLGARVSQGHRGFYYFRGGRRGELSRPKCFRLFSTVETQRMYKEMRGAPDRRDGGASVSLSAGFSVPAGPYPPRAAGGGGDLAGAEGAGRPAAAATGRLARGSGWERPIPGVRGGRFAGGLQVIRKARLAARNTLYINGQTDDFFRRWWVYILPWPPEKQPSCKAHASATWRQILRTQILASARSASSWVFPATRLLAQVLPEPRRSDALTSKQKAAVPDAGT